MAINVAPTQPTMNLSTVRVLEQRTYGTTAYPTVERTWVDGNGDTVKVEIDPPQVQLNLDEWPDLAAAHAAYLALLETASAYLLGYVVAPGQAYNPPVPDPAP